MMKIIRLLCLLMITGMTTSEDNGFVRLKARVGEDVVLPCSLGPEVDIERGSFDWRKGQQDVFLYDAGIHRSADQQFRGRVSHFPDKLKNGNASIIIRNIQLSDSGNYSCIFLRPQQQRFYVELVVGISAEPRVMILEIIEHWALLQCEVRGAFPKPQISWIDSDGTVLPATEKLEYSDDLRCSSTLTLQTNVTKTGTFRCLVAQLQLNHTTEAQISALIFNDKTLTGSDGGLLGVAIVGWILFALCLVVSGIYCWCRRSAMRESHDTGNSSLHPSFLLAKAQETREPTPESEPESEPDEALRITLQESQTSSNRNPNKQCQPFFSS